MEEETLEEQVKEEKYGISYKITAGKKYRVFASNFNGKMFYKIQMTQKNYNGTISKYYKDIKFRKGIEPTDSTGGGMDIIIKKAFESLVPNPKDEYHPISYIIIMDYEIYKRKEEIEQEALNEFRDNLYENENESFDLPF